jgi:hypothetical protein
MSRVLTIVSFWIAVAGISLALETAPLSGNAESPAQSSAPSEQSSTTANAAPRIAPGSVIPAELTMTVDAKKIKVGDKIEARVTQDLKSGNGEMVIPKDTKILGSVTEAQPRTKEQKESQIGIAFDHVVMRNGTDLPLPMSIQAIIAPAALNPQAAAESAGPSSGSGLGGGIPANNPRMGSGAPGQMPSSSEPGDQWPSGQQAGAKPQQPISGDTQGVVGIANLKLSMNPATPQTSLVSSEKSNVKLENGTLMLLRVNR